jgi:hypothetical protein
LRRFAFRHRLDLGKLGHPVHQPGDIGAEQPLDLLGGGQRILHRIVQQRGDDGFLVQLQLGHQPGHFHRMAEIGVAARPFLRAVLLHGIDIGAVQHRLVRIRSIGEHAFDKFVLAQHYIPSMGGRPRAPQGKTGTHTFLSCTRC